MQASEAGEDRRNVEGSDTNKQIQRRKVAGEATKDGGIPKYKQERNKCPKKVATLGRPLRNSDNASRIENQEDCNSRVGNCATKRPQTGKSGSSER